jgi:dCTP deaminase
MAGPVAGGRRKRGPAAAATVAAAAAGLLPSQGIEELIRRGHVTASSPIGDEQIQPASLDLRLGPVGYRVRASFLPNNRSTVASKLTEMGANQEAFLLDLTRPTILEREHVYLIQVMEALSLPPDVSGKASPKSTTGRLDVFTRLITDYADAFELVPAGYRGPLYVEIIPRTFGIIVRAGQKLNQLRLSRGAPEESDLGLSALDARETLVFSRDGEPVPPTIAKGLLVSVDLDGTRERFVGFRAKMDPCVLDLDKRGHYPALDHWDPIVRNSRRQLLLVPDFFYILASKEKIRIPLTHAAEMVPYDPNFGEFRIHYAGFFDPGFGYGSGDIPGARAVLEVRSYGVPCLLEDGQVMGRVVFERLAGLPSKVYGPKIGSSYQEQGVSLASQFAPPE